MILFIAFNYGGRREILDAVGLASPVGVAPAGTLTEVGHIRSSVLAVDARRRPGDPDVGREAAPRTSSCGRPPYSELYLSEKLWPDFGKDDCVALATTLGAARRLRRPGRGWRIMLSHRLLCSRSAFPSGWPFIILGGYFILGLACVLAGPRPARVCTPSSVLTGRTCWWDMWPAWPPCGRVLLRA